MMNVALKFQEAWSQMDISSLSECISEKITYSAVPSGNKLMSKNEIVCLIASRFVLFHEYQAITTLEENMDSHLEFAISLRYNECIPITNYMVNHKGIFIVSCLEVGIVTMKITIQLKCKSNKINEIKIFQKSFFECRKTA